MNVSVKEIFNFWKNVRRFTSFGVKGYITTVGSYYLLAKCLNEVNESLYYDFVLVFKKLTNEYFLQNTKDCQAKHSLFFSNKDSFMELFLVFISCFYSHGVICL